MAFQNLRTGSTVYIFHKDNSPKLEIGQVIAEPKIRQKYPIPTPGQPYAGFMPQQQEQVVDLSIKIGDKVQPIEGLTPSTDIQRYSCRLGRNSMIAGKFYLENYANWHISYFIMTDANDAEEIIDELYSLRCSKRFLNRAKEILYSNRRNIGIAYSNPKYKRSAIVVSKTTDIWEFFNSFAHEVDHIEKHIAKTLNFSPYSESASYLVGEIIRNMFYNITRKMLC